MNRSTNLFILIVVVGITVAYSLFPTIQLANFPFTINEIIYFTIILLSIPFLFNYFKSNKLDNQIGELSYPIYITHGLVALVWGYLHIKTSLNGIIVAGLSIIFSLILNKYISAPLEKYRQKRLVKAS